MAKLDLSAVTAKRDEYAAKPIIPEPLTKASNGYQNTSHKPNRKTVQLGVRVPEDVLEQLKNLSINTDVPVARIVTRMLRNGLAEYGTELERI